MAARPDSKVPDSKDAAPKRGKGVLIGVVVSILVAGAVGAGWHFTRPAAHGGGPDVQAAQKPAEAIFVNLEPFTVNLADEGGERLAQVALVLELADKGAQAALVKNLPIVRNGILLLLSSQHSKTLLTLDGKRALADEIAIRTGAALGWRPEEAHADADDGKAAQTRKVSNAKPRPPRPSPPNPVVAVHFSQLLVQ